jgi:hypothetical protein
MTHKDRKKQEKSFQNFDARTAQRIKPSRPSRGLAGAFRTRRQSSTSETPIPVTKMDPLPMLKVFPEWGAKRK